MLRRRAVIAVTLLLALASCSSSAKTAAPGTSTIPSPPAPTVGALPWPAPADAMARTRAAGLVPRGYETLQHHVHAHLDVFLEGVHQMVPAGLGINIKDPAVHTGPVDGYPGYGGISPPCKQACISPLHTHADTGILHTESPTAVDNTLGELFIEWGVTLDNKCVGGYCSPAWKIAYYVDGKPYTGDPRKMTLTNFEEIAIVIGNPPANIPSTADFTTD
jgi:hypothetical protein